MTDQLQKKDFYHRLTLDHIQGQVIIGLYQNIFIDEEFENRFTERTIKEIIKKVKGNDKTLDVKDNFIITNLRYYYLSVERDNNKNMYSLTPFAEEWCKFIKNKIDKKLESTQIIRDFHALNSSLEQALKRLDIEDDAIDIWMVDIFDRGLPFSILSQSQTIKDKLSEIREEYKTNEYQLNDIEFKEMVDTLLISLENVKEQTDELDNAYNGSSHLQKTINKIEEHPKYLDVMQNVKRIDGFIKNLDKNLRSLEYERGEIAKTVNRFYSNMELRPFLKKTEDFFNFLLEESLIQKVLGKNELQLPIEIDLLLGKKAPKFIQIARRKIKQKNESRKREDTTDYDNFKKQQEADEKEENLNKRIYYWLNEVMTKLENERKVETEYFLNLILTSSEPEDNFDIYILLIDELWDRQTNEYDIVIQPSLIFHKSEFATWNLTIHKH